MTFDTDAEYYRLTFVLSGTRSTRWADALTVGPEGFVAFNDVETGRKRFVSASTEYIITGIPELPPHVRETAGSDEKEATL